MVPETFNFFSHNSTSVRNSESNGSYVFLDKVWICYTFLKCSMHHGPTEFADYMRTNKIRIHYAHFAHLNQS